jgi:hypothetical protein
MGTLYTMSVKELKGLALALFALLWLVLLRLALALLTLLR